MREQLAMLIAITTAICVALAALIFAGLQQQHKQQLAGQLDPLAWATLYPLHVASYQLGQQNAQLPADKLALNPFRVRAWSGHPFAAEYNTARSHYFSQLDLRQSRRTTQFEQPAGCIHCHAAEAPTLIQKLGWDTLNALSYTELRDELVHGSTCADCHDPSSMALRVTRPALTMALARQGIDINQATPRQMRSYVCAQCHVEYYFSGGGNSLALPWANGLRIEQIEQYYNDSDFSDWRHLETGADLIKMQHPNFELHLQGPHGQRDIACADCHMPSVTWQGSQITDHWIRSPMGNVQGACMNCHRGTPERLAERTRRIQSDTNSLLQRTEAALDNLMTAITEAISTGGSEAALLELRQAQRAAQLRWDFVDADASQGFHAARESERMLLEAIDIAESALR